MQRWDSVSASAVKAAASQTTVDRRLQLRAERAVALAGHDELEERHPEPWPEMSSVDWCNGTHGLRV